MFCFFFFFQAEDGIRDLTVTGVQTCALPIWFGRKMRLAQLSMMAGAMLESLMSARLCVAKMTLTFFLRSVLSRSEERRVGEEGRSRGSPDHLKKKKKK